MRDPPALLELARRQHWVISRPQLRELRVSPFTCRSRLARGLWVKHLGAVVVRPAPDGTALQDAQAIALQLPPGGAVSGATALGIWGHPCDGARVPAKLRQLPHIAVVQHPLRPHIGDVQVLRLSRVGPESIVWRRGAPVRTLGEALLDLITVLSPDAGLALLDHSLQLRWVDLPELTALAGPRLGKGRHAAAKIRRLMKQLAGGSHSAAERRMATLLTLAGIRGWIANHQHRAPDGRIIAELDFAWPKERVCLEVDGWQYHSGRQAFENDHARQNLLHANRWTVMRATWDQITRHPQPLIATLRATLAHYSGRKSESH